MHKYYSQGGERVDNINCNVFILHCSQDKYILSHLGNNFFLFNLYSETRLFIIFYRYRILWFQKYIFQKILENACKRVHNTCHDS